MSRIRPYLGPAGMPVATLARHEKRDLIHLGLAIALWGVARSFTSVRTLRP